MSEGLTRWVSKEEEGEARGGKNSSRAGSKLKHYSSTTYSKQLPKSMSQTQKTQHLCILLHTPTTSVLLTPLEHLRNLSQSLRLSTGVQLVYPTVGSFERRKLYLSPYELLRLGLCLIPRVPSGLRWRCEGLRSSCESDGWCRKLVFSVSKEMTISGLTC